MAKIIGYPVVADVDFTTTETIIDIDDCYKLILNPQESCSISLNDNAHYKNYPKGIVLPIEIDSRNDKAINKIYVKGSISGILGVWGFK